jgi:cation diffusion facilitator CzcD-associated flavoprotein CzcO
MPRTERVEVAVIGAGAAGLGAAAALRRLGHDPLLVDRDERVGGTWAGRYERLCLHTVRRFSDLPYHPMPRDLPRYVAKDEYARYLREYVERLGLRVLLGWPVERVRAETGGGWILESPRGSIAAHAVVVATGKHNEKRLPAWPGLEDFRGVLVHSADYRTGSEFTGLEALVIGIGNSGCEIATDLVEQGAARVAIAVRTTPPISAREILGVPVQILGMLLMPFPPGPVDRVGAVMRRLANGDLREYGLGKEAWGPFTARRPPVIDVGFMRELKRRRIEVRPAVARFTESGVVFAGGPVEEFQVVVAATGFETGLDRLLGLSGVVDERGLPNCLRGEACGHPGLYFIGFTESPRGALFEAARDAPRLGATVDRYLRAAR